MAGTIEYLKSLSPEMQHAEAQDIATHYAPQVLKDDDIRAYIRTLPAARFELGTVDLVSFALSDLACEVRITWDADGEHHDAEADGVFTIQGVATGIIDDDGILRWTTVKPAPTPSPA